MSLVQQSNTSKILDKMIFGIVYKNTYISFILRNKDRDLESP